MAKSRITRAESAALQGQEDEIAPDITYPTSLLGLDPDVSLTNFYRNLTRMAMNIPLVDEPDFSPPVVFFDDFFTGGSHLDPDPADDPEADGIGQKFSTVNEYSDWFVGGTNAIDGTITIVDAAPGGWIKFVTAGAEEDALQAQLLGTPFILAAGKPLVFETRLIIEDITKATWFVGLAIVNCTEVTGSGTWGASDDCIGFYGLESGVINYASSEDGTDTAATTGEVFVNGTIATRDTANKSHRLGFKWDGTATVTFYVDGALVATINTTDDDINQDEAMSPIIAIDATAGGAAEAIWVDYVYVAQKR